MRESIIENHLCKLVKQAGGRCYKWVSPGNNGVPDRIVFLRGMCFLVETKRTKVNRLRVAQDIQRRELAKLGFDVVVLNSKTAVEEWVAMQFPLLWRETGILRGSIVKTLTAEETDCDVLDVGYDKYRDSLI